MDYKAFLYKKVDGQVISQIFEGKEAVEDAVDNHGWKDSPAHFVDEAEVLKDLSESQKDGLKLAAETMSQDMNILVNADKIDDIEKLKTAYVSVAGKPMHKRVKTIEGARNACKKLLGDVNGNSSDVH